MNKNHLAILFLAVSNVLCGQNMNQPQAGKNSIGFFFSPDVCYRTLKSDGSSEIADFILSSRNKKESHKFGYTIGLSFAHQMSTHFALEGGLSFSNKGFKTIESDIIVGDSLDPRFGFIGESGLISNIKLVDNFNYLELPLRLTFKTGMNKFRFTASAGLVNSFLLNSIITSQITYLSGDVQRNSSKSLTNFNKWSVSPVVGIGLEWQPGDKVQYRLEPTFRYGITKIIDAPVTAFLWSGGLQFTCLFKIS